MMGATVLLVAAGSEAVRLRQQLSAGGYTVLEATTEPLICEALYQAMPTVALIAGLSPQEARRWCTLIKSNGAMFLPVMVLGALSPATSEDMSQEPDMLWEEWPEAGELQRSLHMLVRVKAQVDQRYAQLDLATARFERIKDAILERLAHELGTPMLQVKTAVALLADDVHQHGKENSREVASMATQAVARLENLIQNIRQLSHSHRITFDLVNLEESADYAIRQLKRNWQLQKAVERVVKRLPAELPPVLSDKFALAHLLQILLDNALRYSPPDQPVIIQAVLIDPDTVLVSVEDFGQGIPPEDIAHITEPFYKVDDATNPHQRGAGLGLALASLLAASLQTALSVESHPGQGSVFAFRLPVADLEEAPVPLL
jgi:signal transduction histidine kinase